ncbi:ribonuclease H-like protein [Xylaria arbuscula]|nr:ribonuclease H-like protein [Xylaria arbuscula]
MNNLRGFMGSRISAFLRSFSRLLGLTPATPIPIVAMLSSIKRQSSTLDRVAVQDGQHGMVDTTAAISSMVDELYGLPTTPPSLYIDLEGVKLSRRGTVSILQIHVRTTGKSYLVDVKTLQNDAFSTPGACTRSTLKAILESVSIPKVFFDVHRDSDALYSHYGIALGGVHDLQLMEIATRRGPKRVIYGLKRCIESHLRMKPAEKSAWTKAKEEGIGLFDPGKGGSYEVFNQRPLPEKIRLYCIEDVHYLARLWDTYDRKMTPAWRTKVLNATKARITESQAPGFNPVARTMSLAPARW